MPAVAANGACPVSVTSISQGDEKLCPAFALRLVRGVKNGPSPEWMQRRLLGIGLRPINALVDITNYITFDRGRPLHVFDAKKVKGNLTVRRAKEGEEVLALDGRTYKLDPSIVVIADESGVESIAGIMGGEHSGCDETTTDVLIESALWDPLNIAQTGRKLGIITDARYRFERGVDPAFTVAGSRPGHPAGDRPLRRRSDAKPRSRDRSPQDNARRRLPLERGSAPVGPRRAAPRNPKVILEKLGFQIHGLGRARERDAAVLASGYRGQGRSRRGGHPHRRRRPHRAEAAAAPRGRGGEADPHPDPEAHPPGAKRTLAARGLVEAVTWSFIAKEEAELFGGGDGRLALANPIASELSDMRPSLLPGLLKAAQRNADRGLGDVALFEVGQTLRLGRAGRPVDQGGRRPSRHGTGRGRRPSLERRGQERSMPSMPRPTCWRLLAALGVPAGGLQIVAGGPAWFHPGRSGTLQFGPKNVVGAFGEVHPKVLKALDLKGPLVAFELNLDALPPPKAKPTKMKPKLTLPDFQPLTRDFAFVVGRDVAAGDIVQGGARGRAPAHRRRRRVRHLRGHRHRPGQEVGGHRRDPAAHGEDADRRGDRGRLSQDRRRGVRRRPARCCGAKRA